MSLAHLPHLNALLNGSCALLLAAGYLSIRGGRIQLHRYLMGSAFLVSVLFLISYLTYHFIHGATRFQGTGVIRLVYFFILITHTILAALIVPLILRTLYLALRNRFADHKKIARWTFPLWLYVSVTGVVVYWMLYQVKWQ